MTIKPLFMLGIVVMSLVSALQPLHALIPQPLEINHQEGQFEFNSRTKWIVENKDQEAIALSLSSQFSKVSGYNYPVVISKKTPQNAVIFRTDNQMADEAYTLEITAKKIILKASSPHGFFNAIQSLRQLLPSEINGKSFVTDKKWTVRAAKITDSPRFAYRGFMLDVSRHFIPKEDVLKLLDQLAYHKINYFHWHLVDDNGWRIEIKKYPKLTDVGAWRVDRGNFFPMRTNPIPHEVSTQGGYYSQDDIREIVKYASERFIEVIPEIEMPAHTNSSLAAYPQFRCPVGNKHLSVLPGIGGTNSSEIYCAGNDSVFSFLEDVLSEVMELFPSEYIHIGGDEATKTNWKQCPLCQARMKENNIPNEEELQSYFIKRINRFLQQNNKKLMGWDELVDSEIPEGATIFGWRGMGDAGEKAGAKGFNFIKSPAQKYYLLRYQGPQWFEPYTYFGNTTLKDVYDYEPAGTELAENVKKHMLGIEACLWTEFVTNSKEAEYLIFPRLSAFAETAWSQPENKDWGSFVKRIDKMVEDFRQSDINFAPSMFNIAHKIEATNGKLKITLENIRPDAEIRYSLDGSEPNAQSNLYISPLKVNAGTSIRAQVFINGKARGRILPLNTFTHKAIGAKIISGEPMAFVLTNGLFGSDKRSDGEWLEIYDRDFSFVMDLGESKTFDLIKISWLNDAGMTIQLPAFVNISVSDDGVDYRNILEKKYGEKEIFQFGLYRHNKQYDCNTQAARYLKFEIKNPGITPVDHVRPNTPTRFALDEIIVL